MNKLILISSLLLSSLFLFQFQLQAQDTLRNKKGGDYLFTVQKDIEANEVQNQNRTGTCWSFSALSFIESELIRTGKGKHKLSEMYVVRKAYEDKAENYVRMHGATNFGQGGAFHDIPHVIKKYGIMPQEAYKGLNYGLESHNHGEMETVLKNMLDAVIKNKQGQLIIPVQFGHVHLWTITSGHGVMLMHSQRNLGIATVKNTNHSGKSSTNCPTQSTLNDWASPHLDLRCLKSSKTTMIQYSLIVTIIILTRLLSPVGVIDQPPIGGMSLLLTTKRGLRRNENLV